MASVQPSVVPAAVSDEVKSPVLEQSDEARESLDAVAVVDSDVATPVKEVPEPMEEQEELKSELSLQTAPALDSHGMASGQPSSVPAAVSDEVKSPVLEQGDEARESLDAVAVVDSDVPTPVKEIPEPMEEQESELSLQTAPALDSNACKVGEESIASVVNVSPECRAMLLEPQGAPETQGLNATPNAVAAPATEPTKFGSMETESVVADSCDETVSALIPVEGNGLGITSEVVSNGLSLLATYDSGEGTDCEEVTHISDSDSETRSVVEVPVTNHKQQHRKQIVADSSDTESDDSSSSSDSDSEAEYLTVLRKEIDKKMKTDQCDDEDEDLEDDGTSNGRPRRRQPPKVRGELLLDELPPIQQLEITVPEDECIELGKVHSIVDQLVLVSVLPNSMLFDLDTVLFLDKGRKVLGEVFDVLGQVADPLYCVRFNSNDHIQERGIKIGDVVYCAPKTEHTQFVILSKLMQVRGSDASWEHDVEPPARYIDYSDDEAEREARSDRRKKRQRERTNSTDSIETTASAATNTTTTTATSESTSRFRGRRGQRENREFPHPIAAHDARSRSHSRDSQYNYHPSYNPGSWHSNYYHNYHAPVANFNLPPGMGFPVPAYGYGMPAHPYAMPGPMAMPMPMPPPTGHMYPPPYGQPPPPPGSS